MKSTIWLVVLSLCSLAGAGACIYAQGGAAAPVKLGQIKHLRKGVDLWPLIGNASTPMEQRINGTLTRLNQGMEETLRECDQNAREDFKNLGEDAPKGQDPTAGDWERTVQVTMSGPRYLSLVASDQSSCGGAHPNSDTLAMVFDLATGRPVDWMGLIAKSAQASPYSDSIADGTKVGSLVVPALLLLSKAKADSECKDAFEDSQSYQLWPDAKSGTLVAEPFGLPHVVAACADDLSLSPDEARKLGFDESLLAAIDEAHKEWIASSLGNPQ
jgi:hypothetical protein